MFKQYARNDYSQNGEDGILEEIFKRLKVENNDKSWAVEFGAWDGKYLNNAFSLVEKGWSCVMIESDDEKYGDLLKTCEEHKTIHPIKAFVSRYDHEDNSLRKLLQNTKLPKHFDLLSIDIDTYDSDVWDTLTEYSAKVVVIEMNSSYKPGIKWRHKLFDEDGKPYISSTLPGSGTTFSEMNDIANYKGYTLVCHTGNGIYVKNEYVDMLDMPKNLIENQDLLYWGP